MKYVSIPPEILFNIHPSSWKTCVFTSSSTDRVDEETSFLGFAPLTFLYGWEIKDPLTRFRMGKQNVFYTLLEPSIWSVYYYHSAIGYGHSKCVIVGEELVRFHRLHLLFCFQIWKIWSASCVCWDYINPTWWFFYIQGKVCRHGFCHDCCAFPSWAVNIVCCFSRYSCRAHCAILHIFPCIQYILELAWAVFSCLLSCRFYVYLFI